LFSKDIQAQVDKLLSRYPIRQNALIPILHLAQNENEGWLSEVWMQHVADICEVPLTHVEGVVTFYTMFRLKPPGKYHLQVCTCVPCCLVGGTELLEHTEKKLDIHAGHTTDDGVFSIEESSGRANASKQANTTTSPRTHYQRHQADGPE
jgi:NADH:ubiquinone oxidoreductase subunit E